MYLRIQEELALKIAQTHRRFINSSLFYFSGDQLNSIRFKGFQPLDARHDNLLQLRKRVRLKSQPSQALKANEKKKTSVISCLQYRGYTQTFFSRHRSLIIQSKPA